MFEGVTTPSLTFIADCEHQGQTSIASSGGAAELAELGWAQPWRNAPHQPLIDKIMAKGKSLGTLVADPGVHTGNCAKKVIFDDKKPNKDLVPVLEGKQISRYACSRPEKYLKLDYPVTGNEYFTIRNKEKYTEAEFVIRQTAAYPIVGPRRGADYFRNSLLALYPPEDGRDIRFLVGLLNSKLMRFVYTTLISESQQKAFPQVKVGSLRKLPIIELDLNQVSEQRPHDEVVKHVQLLLDIYAKKEESPQETEQIDSTIDHLVYQLYGLDDKDIRVIEESTA